MSGGTTPPGAQNMEYRSTLFGGVDGFVKTDPDGRDTFLVSMPGGNDYFASAYLRDGDTATGAPAMMGYVVTGSRTANMRTTGSATYTGKAYATMFRTDANRQWTGGMLAAEGNASLTANFTPSGGTVGGRITGIKVEPGAVNIGAPVNGAPLGLDIVMNPTAITANTYQDGTLGLVQAGTNTASGTMTSSNYQGAFYGSNAEEMGGTFQFGATGLPDTSGGTYNLEAVGTY